MRVLFLLLLAGCQTIPEKPVYFECPNGDVCRPERRFRKKNSAINGLGPISRNIATELDKGKQQWYSPPTID